jgi:hypothetical protein
MSVFELVDKAKTLSLNERRQLVNMLQETLVEEVYYTPSQLMQLSAEERERYVAQSFALASNEDFEIFEA